MPPPLAKSREDALSFLTRLVLWAFAPFALMVLSANVLSSERAMAWRTVAIIAPPVVLVVVVASLLRPSPRRSLRLRGTIAITLMASLAGWGLLINGPRALNAVSAVIAPALAVLFSENRNGARRLVVWASVAMLMLVVVRRIPGALPDGEAQAGGFIADAVTITLMLLGGVYVAYLLWCTLENFRASELALKERGRELIAAQASVQQLLRQEMLARLATDIAGTVAGELDELHAAVASVTDGQQADVQRLREGGARASQTLRLLESLGQPVAMSDRGSNLREVLPKVELALQPITPFGHTLEVINSATSRPLMEPVQLEQLIVYLALRLKKQFPEGTGVLIRAYEGLGDVSRADGRRTWTILDIGRTFAGDTVLSRAVTGAGEGVEIVPALAEEALVAVGGRLACERRDDGVFLVLQLPSR